MESDAMGITVEQIRKVEKQLRQKEELIESLKESLKEAKAEAEKISGDLRRAIRGEEPELELQFVNKKTGEVEK